MESEGGSGYHEREKRIDILKTDSGRDMYSKDRKWKGVVKGGRQELMRDYNYLTGNNKEN